MADGSFAEQPIAERVQSAIDDELSGGILAGFVALTLVARLEVEGGG